MIDKLYALVDGEIMAENLDSTAVHEVLLPGHLYLMILREKLEDSLSMLRMKMMKDLASSKTPSKVVELEYLKNCLLYTSPSPRDQRGSRMPSSA